jgi:hypothetical protein
MAFRCPLLAPAAAVAAVAIAAGAAQAATCAPAGADPVDAIRQMYAGAMAGDRAKTLAAFDPEAYLFDGGVRFTPEAITDFILKAEAAGTKPYWAIFGPESHTACDLAWATWTNHGTFTTAAGAVPKTWLESAVFVWRDGAWKVRFFQSTPVESAAK